MFAKASYLRLPRLGITFGSSKRRGSSIKSVLSPDLNVRKKSTDRISASNKLFKRYSAIVATIFIVGSITPFGTTAEGMYAGDFGAYYVDTSSFSSGIVTDDEGYLTKLNPQTNQGDRSSMSDSITHTVASGETLSVIAENYDLRTSTLLWENDLANANSLRTGQKLAIPPVDGVSHHVGKNDTIDKIAKTYSVDADAIRKQNNLLIADVENGDRVFIPDGKPLISERTSPARVGTSTRVAVGTPVSLANSAAIPTGSRPFIYPTRGKVTQGFRRGHYALDIADASKPPIWSAGSGTVTKASSGTWGGGYGNHIIIDHGNGLQTLYAHMDYLSVGVGDIVDQGQVIGRMGRTGRVYGRTGIHLHFEVILNGVKQVPSNYY